MKIDKITIKRRDDDLWVVLVDGYVGLLEHVDENDKSWDGKPAARMCVSNQRVNNIGIVSRPATYTILDGKGGTGFAFGVEDVSKLSDILVALTKLAREHKQ